MSAVSPGLNLNCLNSVDLAELLLMMHLTAAFNYLVVADVQTCKGFGYVTFALR